MSRALLALVAFALVVLVVAAGRAHELSSGTLSLEERTPGVFAMRWTPPATPLAGAVAVRPEFPEHCSVLPRLVDCGSQGLVGPLVFAGLSETSYRVLGRIAWHGGREQSFVVTGESPSVELRGALASAGAGATLRSSDSSGGSRGLLGPAPPSGHQRSIASSRSACLMGLAT